MRDLDISDELGSCMSDEWTHRSGEKLGRERASEDMLRALWGKS